MSSTKALLQHLGGMPVDMPMGLVPSRVGKVFFVDPYRGSDSAGGSFGRPLATLSEAHSRMTADNNDIAFVHGGASATNFAVRELTTLAWSKDSCHIIGLNAYQRVSHRVSIRVDSSVTTVFTPFVNVTADNCVFANFHVFYGFDDASGQVCWDDNGDRNIYYNVHIGGFGHQTAADHASSVALSLGSGGNGEHYFKNCTFGIDTINRGAANTTIELVGGCTRTIFEDCQFLMRADAATPVHITVGAGGIDRYARFIRCFLHNFTGGGGTTANQFMSVNAAAGGNILMEDCWWLGATNLETTAAGVVYVNNPVVDTQDGGVYIVNAP